MADVHDKETRSRNMSSIKGKDTGIEMLVRKYLFANGYRGYRVNVKKIPGKPDIVLSKLKTIIEVHGCFWHAHENCSFATRPEDNSEFWRKKLEDNIRRDKKKEKQWKELGWNVIVVWGCDLEPPVQNKTLAKLLRKLERLKHANTGN